MQNSFSNFKMNSPGISPGVSPGINLGISRVEEGGIVIMQVWHTPGLFTCRESAA